MPDEATEDTFKPLPDIFSEMETSHRNLTQELDKFALSLAQAMQKEDVPFAQKMDAFRALTAYHSSSAKTKKLTGDDDADDGQPSRSDFSDLKRQIRVVGGEHGTVKASTG